MKNWRTNLIFIIFILFSAVIISRLIYLQVAQGDFYKALAEGYFGVKEKDQPDRGEIFLKNGEPLAVNKTFFSVFASPPKVKDIEKTAEILSEILNLDKNFILDCLNGETLYSPIKNRLEEKEVEAIKNLDLAGIYLDKKRGRYYPQESLASQAIGFVDSERNGQYGLEEYYDEKLKEQSNLFLTIDYNIQFKAEKLLEKAKDDLESEEGEIIILDPNSGKIIALAHFPNFNPNQYQQYATNEKLRIFRNKATQDLFEPGSIFKPITMAAGLEEGVISASTTYYDEGYIKIGGYTIHNYDNRTWGEETMARVLENSINTGAVFVQKKLPDKVFVDYIQKFGFFEKTGIDLPETCSENKEFKQLREINLATASFGQGIEMTPIQLVRAYSAIANKGKLVKPYLVEKIVSPIGETVETSPEFSNQIISQKAADELTSMLVGVVERGSAKRTKIPGYHIAAKTGTSQIAFSALGIPEFGYSQKTIQTAIGFFPAFSPQFVILVKLDNPKTRVSEYSAVPIFHDLAEYIIHYYQIPPDYEE